MKREDLMSITLLGSENIGIELGVASGEFSKAILRSRKFKKVYGVDSYSDHHDSNEYVDTLKQIGLDENYVLIRARFDEAVDLFPDEYFDFIYIDGYAHTGQEGGETLEQWYPKLKKFGVFSGHDYHYDWPLTMATVEDFVARHGLKLQITEEQNNFENKNTYPSWYVEKPGI